MSHFSYLPTPLLPGTPASHPAAKAHTQTIRSWAVCSSNSPAVSLHLALPLSHTGTRPPLTNPHPSCHKKAEDPCAPSTSSWHLVQTMLTQPPPPNCSTCSTWPHMFHFFSYNKLKQKLFSEFALPAPSLHTKTRARARSVWVTVTFD